MSKVDEDLSGYRCFICWDDIDFEDTSTKIVSACNCISTDFKYTHKECLNLWINQNRHSGLKCQVCGTSYHVKKVYKPLKKIFKENWKSINFLICGVILINTILWLLCIQWGKELEKIHKGYYEDSEYESLSKYDTWINGYDEREAYIEEYISEINFKRIFRNIYLNVTTLFLFVNTSIFLIYFYYEKDKFVEYSIDAKYEYKGKSTSPSSYRIVNHDKNDNYTLQNDELSIRDKNRIKYNFSNTTDYKYQQIIVI